MEHEIPDAELTWKKVDGTDIWEMRHPKTHRRARMKDIGFGKCRFEIYRGGMLPIIIKGIGHMACLRRARQNMRTGIIRLSAESHPEA